MTILTLALPAILTMAVLAALAGMGWWASRLYGSNPRLIPKRANPWAVGGMILAIIGLVAGANGLLRL